MRPFDHVLLGDWEFMLWYRNDEEEPEWWAIDPYNNKVGISEPDLTLLPPICTYYGEWVTEPRFFGELLVDNKWTQFEITNVSMVSSVKDGTTNGKFIKDGIVWKWDIKDLTLFKETQRWLLRVMTPGGRWL